MTSNIAVAGLAGVTALAGRAALGKSANLAGMGFMKKAWTLINAAPKPVKIIAGALAGLSILYRTYKAGVIEQKYIDRAQFVDNTFKPDAEVK